MSILAKSEADDEHGDECEVNYFHAVILRKHLCHSIDRDQQWKIMPLLARAARERLLRRFYLAERNHSGVSHAIGLDNVDPEKTFLQADLDVREGHETRLQHEHGRDRLIVLGHIIPGPG